MAADRTTGAVSCLDAALFHTGQGRNVVPVPMGEKSPIIVGWQNLRLTAAELPHHFGDGQNVGLILGETSRNIVDVDLDCAEAQQLAPHFLLDTQMVHGRPSKPRSHYWFVANPAPALKKFTGPDNECLLELRSTGQQTLVPPSLHPSGEVFFWESEGPPSVVEAQRLQQAVARLAAAALLARAWPAQGTRHDAALALAGVLLRGGFSEEETSNFVAAVAECAGDEEVRGRVRDVISTARRLDSGQPATGLPTLARIFGDGVARRVSEWLKLGLRAEVTEPEALTPEWPALDERALIGLAGDVVRALEPHTEADPAAILVQLLALLGNAIGRRAHFRVEGTSHFTNIFVVLVGTTAKGRKGSSFSQVERIFEAALPEWLKSRVHRGGLASGEGVIWAVRDPVEKAERTSKRGEAPRYQVIVVDPGISDKRLLIFEPEFASVLRVIERQGNTLSAVIREGWDSGMLASLTKNSPAKATDAHISIIAHVTKEELLRYLTTTEAASGFANRFLFVCVRRSKFLPEGSVVPSATITQLQRRLSDAIHAATEIDLLERDEPARAIWHEVYPALSSGQPGLVGYVTARAEAQVLRLSMLYALLDGSPVIQERHLLAALALWEYAEASARFIFGDALGDPTADQILKALRDSSSGLSRTEISGLFGRHRPAADIQRALRSLAEIGLVRRETRETDGRRAEVWVCSECAEAKKTKYAK